MKNNYVAGFEGWGKHKFFLPLCHSNSTLILFFKLDTQLSPRPLFITSWLLPINLKVIFTNIDIHHFPLRTLKIFCLTFICLFGPVYLPKLSICVFTPVLIANKVSNCLCNQNLFNIPTFKLNILLSSMVEVYWSLACLCSSTPCNNSLFRFICQWLSISYGKLPSLNM